MRADETLARIETFQSNEAGYGVVELKIGAVPAEGGRSDDQRARGVDPIDQHGPPLSREIPHPAKRNQRECRKPDSDRNQSDATHNRMLRTRQGIIESTYERVKCGFTTRLPYHMLWW